MPEVRAGAVRRDCIRAGVKLVEDKPGGVGRILPQILAQVGGLGAAGSHQRI